jgi:hypothetical protein
MGRASGTVGSTVCAGGEPRGSATLAVDAATNTIVAAILTTSSEGDAG